MAHAKLAKFQAHKISKMEGDKEEEIPHSRTFTFPTPRVQGRPPRNTNQAATQDNSSVSPSDHPNLNLRAHSAGEIIITPGRTDVSLDDGLVKHNQTVPWNNRYSTDRNEAVASDSIIQPVLEGDSPASKSIHAKLTMAEIVNPAESEAEKQILRSLEQRDNSMNDTNSYASMFPNLGDSAAKTFMDHLTDQVGAVSQSGRDDHPSPGLPPKSVGSRGSRESLDHQSPRRRSNTASSTPRRDNGSPKPTSPKSPSTQETPCSIRRSDATASKQSIGGESTGGVDTTLFGLATMMRNLHHEANKQQRESMEDEHIDHHRKATNEIGHPLASFKEQPTTGTDQLVAHAALLFRGKLNKTGDHFSAGSLHDGSEADPKKNDTLVEEGDDEDSLHADVELGHNSSSDGGRKGNDQKEQVGKGRMFHRSFVKRAYQNAIGTARVDWEKFNDFVGEKKKSSLSYAKSIILWLFVPVLGVSSLLFYVLGNPLMITGASISWFLMFIGVRQVITFSMAKAMELFVIDFLALKTRLMLRLVGPMITLIIVQSKGWPSTLFWWSVFDLMMLSGPNRFANHWMFYQNIIKLFSESNPSGHITEGVWNFRILIAALCVSIVVAIKRFAVGLHLGGRTYRNYGPKLTAVIHKMIIISQVAALARKFEREDANSGGGSADKYQKNQAYGWTFKVFGDYGTLPYDDDGEMDEEGQQRVLSDDEEEKGRDDENINFGEHNKFTRSLNSSEKFKLTELLDRWEEPQEEENVGKVSIHAILQFKQTLAFMDLTYPFSASFGVADSREKCLESAQEIFRLLTESRGSKGAALDFETLTGLARDSNSDVDEARVKDLVRVFRPDRTGNLSMIDFLRSVDLVYKDLRLLRAAIQNSSQIDRAFEAILNVAFYFLVGCVVLAAWNIDPLALFLSLSSIIVAFSFAVGSASAKYFEGLMFILGRTPYDVGDRISINRPDEPPGMDGVATWFVENVTLYCTTLRLGATNEVATVANSNMANARIVNAARSPRALVYVTLKFGIGTPYAKLQVFKDTMEAFVKQRPREWLNCSGIRATRVMADLGYIEYIIILQHRESWQQIGTILQSKAELMNYSLEVQKKLDIKYQQPSKPVNLTVNNPSDLHEVMKPTINPAEEGLDMQSRLASDQPRHRPLPSRDLREIAAMFK